MEFWFACALQRQSPPIIAVPVQTSVPMASTGKHIPPESQGPASHAGVRRGLLIPALSNDRHPGFREVSKPARDGKMVSPTVQTGLAFPSTMHYPTVLRCWNVRTAACLWALLTCCGAPAATPLTEGLSTEPRMRVSAQGAPHTERKGSAKPRHTRPPATQRSSSEETRAERDRRLSRECRGRPNAGACLGYAQP